MDAGMKWPVATVLLVAACVWSVPAAAFCFSMGGGSRSHAGNYPPPFAPGFGAGWYPASPYLAPAPRAVILPAVLREEPLPPVTDSPPVPAQQIFK